MKNQCIWLFMIGLIGLLFACSSPYNERFNQHQNKETSVKPIEQMVDRGNEDTSVGGEEIFTFIGIIEDIHIRSNTALISVVEGEILASGNLVGSVELSTASDVTLKVGDKVRVGFDGIIRESQPLGIKTIFVELLE